MPLSLPRKPVHLVGLTRAHDEAQLYCTGAWVRPGARSETVIAGVYCAAVTAELYTYGRELVTCEVCAEKREKGWRGVVGAG